MIIVDSALEEREASGNPIRVGMMGAGFMGRGIALQIVQVTKGMELVAIASRTPDNASRAYREAGLEAVPVGNPAALEEAIRRGRPAVTDDPSLLCGARASTRSSRSQAQWSSGPESCSTRSSTASTSS